MVTGDAEAQSNDTAPDVFISYARTDQELVVRLAAELEAAGWRVWVDVEDIPPTADWSDELAAGIRTAHTFVFVISPRSVRSEYCAHELEQAVELGKRLVPLVLEDTDGVPGPLAARQYLYLRTDDFEASVRALSQALTTDLEWVREHREWLTAALRWDVAGRDRSLLIRGRDLAAAEAWLAKQAERTEPRPTRLQIDFLVASRSWQTRRLRITVAAVVVALSVSILLGVLALFQRDRARNQAAIARSRELAIASASQLSVNPELSLLLGIHAVESRPTAEASTALRNAMAADRLTAEYSIRGSDVRTLVNSVAFTPDETGIVVALAGGTARFIDTRTPGRPRTVSLPVAAKGDDMCSSFRNAQGDQRLAVSTDGRLVAAAGNRGLIQVWSLAHPRVPVRSSFCLGSAEPPSLIAYTTAVLKHSGIGTLALTFARDREIAAVSEDGRVTRWYWRSHTRPTLVRVAKGPVIAAAFAGNDPDRIVYADRTSVGEWAAGRRLTAPRNFRDATAVAASADGSRFTAARGHSIAVWSVNGSTPTERRSPVAVRSLALSPDGERVAAGDNAGTIRVWDLAQPAPPAVLLGSQQAVTALAFSADGKHILSGADDGLVRVWNWQPVTLAVTAPAGKDVGSALAMEIERVASGRTRSRVTRVLDEGRFRALGGVISFDADGRRAVVATYTHAVELLDASTSSSLQLVDAGRRVDTAALSPDGELIASGEENRLRLLHWPGRTGIVLASAAILKGKFSDYVGASFSGDGRSLAAAAYFGKASTVTVWKLSPHQVDETRTLTRPATSASFTVPGAVTNLVFDSAGTSLLGASSDGSVRVWNLQDGSLLVLSGHSGPVYGAAFSPTGEEVVTGGQDGTVRVWELADGSKGVTIPAGLGLIGGVAFTRGGADVEAVGARGARVWPCAFCGSTADVLARARRMTTRGLTSHEQAQYLHH